MPESAFPIDLRCEHAINPLGIDTQLPRFSWRVECDQSGVVQEAYQVLVASTEEALARNHGDLWDSGPVAATRSTNIVFAGRALLSRQRCFWKVRVWASNGEPTRWSDQAWFELALLHASDWKALWIGQPGTVSSEAKYFRCSFALQAAVTRARLYVTGLGYHEALINGIRLGDAVLDPAYTDVTKRVLYATHDVTSVLHIGENVIAATVGAGWHGVPILLAQLEVACVGGSTLLLTTGRQVGAPTWWVASGPIKANSVFDGETYDARLEQKEFNLPQESASVPPLRESSWAEASVVRAPGGRLAASMIEPIRVMRELTPIGWSEPEPAVFVFDFGQNHAGWVRIRVCGRRGATLTLKYAESLHPDGTVNQANLRKALATDSYTLCGDGEEVWTPRFTYHGYRYVQLEGFPGRPSAKTLTSCLVRTALADRGEFTCSHPLLNRIHGLVRATEESNLHGIPTDCPQRDERMGWLNDLAARSETLVYNFDTVRFFEKFAADIRDAQDPYNGALSDTVPYHWGCQPADPVSICYLLIPWLLHQHYGDLRVLEDNYKGMRHWVDFLTSEARDYIVTYSYYGDWAPPATEAVAGSTGNGAISAKTPGELISTAFFFYAADTLSQIADVLGHEADGVAYRNLADAIRTKFHEHFWNGPEVGYGSGNQACNAIALHLAIPPSHLHQTVVGLLVGDVRKHGHHLTTGNLCTKYLLEGLSAHGHFDDAAAIATRTTYPGWGFMLENGATTLWERWEYLTDGGMNSHNHPMLGSVDAWLFRWVAGLALGEPRDGNPHFLIRPPATHFITAARGLLRTIWGEASVDWRHFNGILKVDTVIPWNCTASVRLPDKTTHEISCGRHRFECDLARFSSEEIQT